MRAEEVLTKNSNQILSQKNGWGEYQILRAHSLWSQGSIDFVDSNASRYNDFVGFENFDLIESNYWNTWSISSFGIENFYI